MTIPKEVLSDLKDKYVEAEKLIEEDSKHDPPTEPYRSHYDARNILNELITNVKNAMITLESNNGSSDDLQKYKFIFAHVKIDLGKIAMFVDELSVAEKNFHDGIDLLSELYLHPAAVCAYIYGLNQTGILWSNRADVEQAKEYLDNAEETYQAFKKTGSIPLTIYDTFGPSDEIEPGKGEKMLEKINTLTLFYLAQVYGNLGDLHKSAIYCHTTLKKQLLMNEYDSIDWALNSATLSQYFCTNNRYTEARHHLAAATQIMEEFEKVMFKDDMTDDEKKAMEETYNHRLADIYRCWMKYAINLLSDSRDRLLDDNETPDVNKLSIGNLLTFGSAIDRAYENVITDRYLLDVDDARPVFLMLQNWIEKAKIYYTSETEATEYSKIIQDYSTGYKHLAFFESDPSNQAKMHKRRIDLLEGLLELLNKIFYMNIVREVLYELGTAYSNILDIKLDTLEGTSANGPNPSVLKKINDLCTKTLKSFQEYISTYYEAKTEKLKSDLDVDELKPIAFAHFQIARIYNKFITPDKNLQASNVGNCLKNYQKFIAICEEHKNVGDAMKAEVAISKEMVTLLPLKLRRLIESGAIQAN